MQRTITRKFATTSQKPSVPVKISLFLGRPSESSKQEDLTENPFFGLQTTRKPGMRQPKKTETIWTSPSIHDSVVARSVRLLVKYLKNWAGKNLFHCESLYYFQFRRFVIPPFQFIFFARMKFSTFLDALSGISTSPRVAMFSSATGPS